MGAGRSIHPADRDLDPQKLGVRGRRRQDTEGESTQSRETQPHQRIQKK
jgi:hypothetical protein